MLQQTRVETVVPYYERFLARFPDPTALAGAPEADVLSAWSGLGYYRRARHLHHAAALVVRDHRGLVPEDPSLLRTLPGVGEYTAAAIASIAFDRPAAAVDGNVIRALARIRGWKGRRDSGPLRRAASRFASELAHGPRSGDWTQALMELGATVCLPRDPRCSGCPARARCRAASSGHPDRYPAPAASSAPKRERRLLLLARRGDRVLLLPDRGVDGASWTLPTATVGARAGSCAVAQTLARGLGLDVEPNGPARVFRHRTFSHDLTFEVWRSRPSTRRGVPASGRAPAGARWTRLDSLDSFPLRAPSLKALRKVESRSGNRSLVRKMGLLK
jgi:A/G-specific adenine glycosylase